MIWGNREISVIFKKIYHLMENYDGNTEKNINLLTKAHYKRRC